MYLTIARKTGSTRLNNYMKQVQDPFKTTVKGLTDANVRVACSKIQSKIITYGICSDREQAFLSKHTDFGKIDKKKVFS